MVSDWNRMMEMQEKRSRSDFKSLQECNVPYWPLWVSPTAWFGSLFCRRIQRLLRLKTRRSRNLDVPLIHGLWVDEHSLHANRYVMRGDTRQSITTYQLDLLATWAPRPAHLYIFRLGFPVNTVKHRNYKNIPNIPDIRLLSGFCHPGGATSWVLRSGMWSHVGRAGSKFLECSESDSNVSLPSHCQRCLAMCLQHRFLALPDLWYFDTIWMLVYEIYTTDSGLSDPPCLRFIGVLRRTA